MSTQMTSELGLKNLGLYEIVDTTDYSSKQDTDKRFVEFTINDLMGSWAERLIYSSLDNPDLDKYRQ